MLRPFIIYALPRSRTAWLAAFLTYGDWACHHEQAIKMRSMDDVRALLNRPNTGVAETAAAQGRMLIRHVAPGIREVVVLRSVEDVVKSMMAVELDDVATYDMKLLHRNMVYGSRELQRIAKDKNVLVIQYADLDKMETCKAIFEFCLPYKFDHTWWEALKNENIQVDVKAVMLYYFSNLDAINAFKRHCKTELRQLLKSGQIRKEGVI